MASNSCGLFGFIQNLILRKIIEVLFSSIPGAIIFFVFIIATGILNILSTSGTENNIFALTYIPVVCVLPIVIGVIGPLILEKVRSNPTLSLRASVLVSFISAFVGSFFGAFALAITGVVSEGFSPFGGLLEPVLGAPGLLLAMVLIVFISTILSTIGGALITVLLNRAGN